MNSRFVRCASAIAAVLISVTAVATPVDYALVTVGNPGNPSDATGFGGVGYEYQIGKYEVTLGQYVVFLNAVAASSDPNGLYHEYMPLSLNTAGIVRSGSSGSYSYSVTGPAGIAYGQSAAARPVGHVSWFDAARFANWMSNGQPSGLQNAATTENGAYDLSTATPFVAPARNSINPNTTAPPAYFVPTENEWYKAAYYSPVLNQGAGGYYRYATQSNVAPGNVMGNLANQANIVTSVYSLTQGWPLDFYQNYLTDVGSYSASSSFYGTYDQIGNVSEWNDLTGVAGTRGERGGAFLHVGEYETALSRFTIEPSHQISDKGFRLSVAPPVPEPSTIAMAFAGLFCCGYSTWRRRMFTHVQRSPHASP